MKTCTLCGYELDEKQLRPCESCPMDSNCQVVCCPNCGYGQVDVQTSTLARWFSTVINPKEAKAQPPTNCRLSEVPPGRQVRVRGYGDLPSGKLEQLQAYGLVIGREVQVLQQDPLTVVLADYTELALEGRLAEQVSVDMPVED